MDAILNKRKNIKSQITRLENSILQPLTKIELISLTESDVAFYLKKVQKLTTELETVQESIMHKCKPEESEVHDVEYNSIMTRLEAMERLLLDADFKRQGAAAANVMVPSTPTSGIKLPPIDLPKFGGNYIEWFPFHDLFVATVHNNSLLSGAQKLHYLKNSMYGDAALLIQSLQLTDGNYMEAWDILKNRFHNTREIIEAHVRRLFNQPSVKEESSAALRRLIDTSSECIRSLKVLNQPVDHWDAILIYTVKEKLDIESRRQWELSLTGTNCPKYEELSTFLEQRARALSASQPSSISSRTREFNHQRKHMTSHHGAVKGKCIICDEDHPIYRCPKFIKSTVEERWIMVKKYSVCFNCLRPDHQSNDCKWGCCKLCKLKHNSLLHRRNQEPKNASPGISAHVSRELSSLSTRQYGDFQVLLPTAIIETRDDTGHFQPLRALLDSASQATFISEQGVRRLNLKRTRCNLTIGGIGAMGIGTSRGSVELHIKTNPNHILSVVALILTKVTENLPSQSFNLSKLAHIRDLKLADPTFNISGPVDILLGADVYFNVVKEGKYQGGRHLPAAFKTSFGWAIGGSLYQDGPLTPATSIQIHACTLDEQLAKFWEIEEITVTKILTSDERLCEDIFEKTHTRSETGRFIVRLPFKTNPKELGDSRKSAVRRFLYLERRLQNNLELYNQYRTFMTEYINMGHMKLVAPKQDVDTAYYLPHHAVIKDSSTTTKLRVVFDASAKTTSGKSLNDILLVGPKLQDDLIKLLLRFRFSPIVMTADIAKMYRQILVHPDDTIWQRIIWRDNPTKPLEEYQLVTVTYGMVSAPYLATRSLQQLSQDVKKELPLASVSLSEDFYMDDLMAGVETISEGFQLQNELLQAAGRAGFDLRKWTSNEPRLLENLSPELREIQGPMRLDSDETIKTLGLQWTPGPDHFTFAVTSPETRVVVTKRTILSDTAKIFDPLGLIAPVTIVAKLLLQDMWQLKKDWDEELPAFMVQKWQLFREDLPNIEKIKTVRYIAQKDTHEQSLHGFSDASEKAFAATVYLKTVSRSGQIKIQLIIAKTRVAPLKKTTLPRLELCGAVLLAKLIQIVQNARKEQFSNIHCWTDSTIVLAWVSSAPQRWKTFVANRVAEVQDLLPTAHWHHVPGDANPADCASRGIQATELLQHQLWWNGPAWLRNWTSTESTSSIMEPIECTTEERTIVPIVFHCQVNNDLLHRYASLCTLINVTAYIKRIAYNARLHAGESRRTGPLSTEEREKALIFWIQRTQQEAFPEDYEQLKQKKTLSTKSKLRTLYPFLDVHGTIRVGGRLQNAELSPDKIHPMVLPRKSDLVDLIINHEHLKQLHCGPQLLISCLQRKYWILGIRDAARFHIRRCVRCVRQQATAAKQLMGNLPKARVTQNRAFLNCGIDYAGPFQLAIRKGRGQKQFKAYVALFVCFSTRALHLELVNDMTTEAFLAALKRFVSRRGKCANIYSDCGSNFIGAERELKAFIKFMATTSTQTQIAKWSTEEEIQWHFNPPAAPHFGGLWEAGVKSMKFHLKRVIGNVILTGEEFQTLLCQIEACLNSRPLTSMSTDPGDLAVLTPGHFLIGGPLTAIPEPDLTLTPINHLSRWQLSQRMLQQFWKRWSQEYLSRLQQRPKWATPHPNLKIGDIVLVKDGHMAPTQWRMGRILEVHPGIDGSVRVATVKTADSQIKRQIVKLCPLPLE